MKYGAKKPKIIHQTCVYASTILIDYVLACVFFLLFSTSCQYHTYALTNVPGRLFFYPSPSPPLQHDPVTVSVASAAHWSYFSLTAASYSAIHCANPLSWKPKVNLAGQAGLLGPTDDWA